MKKRNIDIKLNLLKLVGAAMAMSLLFSTNVYAEELDGFVNSEDITTMSDEIETLSDKVDTISENNSDDELSNDISSVSDGLGVLEDLIASVMKQFNEVKASLYQYKSNIISALNSNVYSQNNISSDASFEDVVDKINDIKYMGTVDITIDSNDTYTLESGYYDGGTIDVSALYEAARAEGFEAGKEEGYNEGLEEGKKQGESTGYKKGYDAGKKAGDKAGYDRGLAEGKKQGDAAGYNRAKTEIINNGSGKKYTMSFNGATSNKNKVSGVLNIPAQYLNGYSKYYVTVTVYKGSNIVLEANDSSINQNTRYSIPGGRDLKIYARAFSGDAANDTVDMKVEVTLEK